MPNYLYCYKDILPLDADWPNHDPWDLFVSAYDGSDRVCTAFGRARARQKHWLLLPEYAISAPPGSSSDYVIKALTGPDAVSISGYLNALGLDLRSARICVDITGFVHTYVLLLLLLLARSGARRVDIIYSEPVKYRDGERTAFTAGEVTRIDMVPGYHGIHAPDSRNDLLIIGMGYDHLLAAHVARHKEKCRKVQLFGLPSLRADMYQQSRLSALEVEDTIGGADLCFAPANDPFATAHVLHETVSKENRIRAVTNLYLSPLATKAQALGFGLYYLAECQGKPVSVIYPYCTRKSIDTARGISRVWKYTVELT